MNRRTMYAMLALSVVLSLGGLLAIAQPKGDAVTLKGEVIDLWCYFEGGDHGADHKKCAVTCAKAGDPIALLSEKGDLYILMGIKDHDPAKDMLIDKMADNVTVEGTLVKKGRVQAIYVTSIK